MLQNVDKKKDFKKYKILMKYKKQFTNKMTVGDMIKFDQDLMRHGFISV